MSIPLTITSEKQGKKKKIIEKSLIDSGAGGKFIDQNFAKAQGFELTRLRTHTTSQTNSSLQCRWNP